MKKKIVLITGAAGMVGSNLIRRYIKKKNLVIVAIDNLVLGNIDNLDAYIKKKNFFFFKKDLSTNLRDKNFYKIIKKNVISEIWLLAANSDIRKGIYNDKIDYTNTFLSTSNFLNLIKNYIKKSTKIIFSSSSAIYGNYNGIINEEINKFKPISNYGKMKLLSEKYIYNFSYKRNIKSLIFRFPNVIGKNLTHGVIFDLNKKLSTNKNYFNILGNGNQTKPYSDVEEILDCIFFLKDKKFRNIINYFNIGTNDKGISVKNIVKIMLSKRKLKKKPIYQKKLYGWKGDVPTYRYSTKKINNLGFKFKLSSKQSVIKAINNLK